MAIEDFYVDDAVPYLDDIEDECTALINASVTILNTPATAIYTVDSAYTPATPVTFTKDSFKAFIEIVEDYIENVSN